jgi:hypothetical protein
MITEESLFKLKRIKITVFWVVTPRRIDSAQRYEGTFRTTRCYSPDGHRHENLKSSIKLLLLMNLAQNPFSWYYIFSLLSLFGKNKVGLWDHVAVCVCLCISPLTFECLNQSLWNLVRISTAYLKNFSHQSVCLYLYLPIVARPRLDKNPPIVARQRLGKNPPIVARQRRGRNVTAVTNTHATVEELLDVSFSMWPVSYQGK